MEKFLINHPNFVKKLEVITANEYFFNEKLSIVMSKKFDANNGEPIGWDTTNLQFWELHQTPSWFSELYKEVLHQYYIKNRLRYKINNEKMYIRPFLELFCFELTYYRNEDDSVSLWVDEHHQKTMELFLEYIKPIDYVLVKKEIGFKRIHYMIT
jgi:hypothetical protein